MGSASGDAKLPQITARHLYLPPALITQTNFPGTNSASGSISDLLTGRIAFVSAVKDLYSASIESYHFSFSILTLWRGTVTV